MTSPADGVDGAFVPRVKAGAAVAEIDGEAVVMDDETGRLYRLDSVATVVWGCLDGTVSIDELARELARDFGAPVATVREDVIALVRRLAADGLVTSA